MMTDDEVRKAQLILVGGRPLPNMITILHEKPDIIVAITSKDAKHEVSFLKAAINALLEGKEHEIDTPEVDAFEVDEIKEACENAVKQHKNVKWLFNITGATTIMGIGAYEVAKAHQENVRWWYLNTADTSIVTHSGKEKKEDLYDISVEQYLTATYCRTEGKYIADEKTLQEQTWLPFAQRLGKNPDLAAHLKNITVKIQQINQSRSEQDKIAGRQRNPNRSQEPYELSGLTSSSLSLLQNAAECGIVSNLSLNGDLCKFTLTPLQFQFLDGTWLEVYVYQSIKAFVKSSDIDWGKYIYIKNGKKQELDVVVTFKGKLFLIECKTGSDAFSQKTFQALDSIANPVGGNFVTKIVATSLSESNASNLEDMKMRAETSRINFFYKESLPSIGEEFVKFASKSKGQ